MSRREFYEFRFQDRQAGAGVPQYVVHALSWRLARLNIPADDIKSVGWNTGGYG